MSKFKPYLELEFSGKAREQLGYIGEPTEWISLKKQS